jgi:hypothetical protein
MRAAAEEEPDHQTPPGDDAGRGPRRCGKWPNPFIASANPRRLSQTDHAIAKGPAVKWITPTAALAACALAVPAAFAVGTPAAHARNGDTHVTGQGVEQTLDCNDSSLLVDGTSNTSTR